MRRVIVLLAALLFLSPVKAQEPETPTALVDSAHATLQKILPHRSMQWVRDNIKDAYGVMIIPQMVTAGFVLGGTGGQGILLAQDANTRTWSDPAFYKVGGISIGLQVGAKSAEVLILVRTEQALLSLMQNTGKFSAAGSVAAGPAGEGAASNINADMVTYSLNKGAFVGASIGGSGIEPYPEYNQEYYGKDVGPNEILIQRTVSNAHSDALKSTLSEATR